MSLFVQDLQFSAAERQAFPILQHLAWLARHKWNVNEVFQYYQIPVKESEQLIRFLDNLSAYILYTLKSTETYTETHVFCACVEFVSQANTIHALRNEAVLRAILREFWRATPPPYCLTREFERANAEITGVTPPSNTRFLPSAAPEKPTPKRMRSTRRKRKEA